MVVRTDSAEETARVVDCLAGAGHSVQLAPAVDASVDLVVADFEAGDLEVLDELDAARSIVPAIPFVVVSGPVGADVAV
ncbi:MAG: hypothetical protein Q8K72_18340, partial [Acidimicrobiales bacterium]|nr:hypothetical protein [Acidimicrobiales bacterium]